MRVVKVFDQLLVHTKGRYARAPFNLADWQRDEIIIPVFGYQRWSDEHQRFVRQYRKLWIEIARKNGKSEILAAIALILLAFDDEWGAEIYGAAKDRDQARKVFDVAARMVELSAGLRSRLKTLNQAKRIVYEPTGSFYEAIPADAPGNLGHNPHGIIFDEVLTQPNGDLWGVLEEGTGTREQWLMAAATTAGNDPVGFPAEKHNEMITILDDPRLDPYTYVYMRNTPREADWQDESNWHFANPALGDFLSLETLRNEADQAKRSLRKQNRFRQFKLNQWVQQLDRWLDLDAWDESAGLVVEHDLAGRECFGGIDLAQTKDLTSIAWLFPPVEADGAYKVLWRHFTPEANLEDLRRRTGGQSDEWIRDGYIKVTAGNVVDYDAFMHQVDLDAQQFGVLEVGYDPWGPAPAIVQKLQDVGGLKMVPVRQGFGTLNAPSKQLERLLLKGVFQHGGNPCVRWQADNITVRTDPAGNIKPDKERSGDKIDGIVAAIIALDREMRDEGRGRMPLVSFT
jgi:phage terminase large subunit-like protein